MQTSRSDTSLMAMVPDSEWRTPTLTVPAPCARSTAGKPIPAAAPRPTAAVVLRKFPAREILHTYLLLTAGEWLGPLVGPSSGGTGARPRTPLSRRAAPRESKLHAQPSGQSFRTITAKSLANKDEATAYTIGSRLDVPQKTAELAGGTERTEPVGQEQGTGHSAMVLRVSMAVFWIRRKPRAR
jgi:hypothetical protein